MLDRQLKHILDIYENRLNEMKVVAQKDGTPAQHIAWMVAQARLLNTDRLKTQRWVGFIQGWMWCNSIFTIDEMREHVRTAISNGQ